MSNLKGFSRRDFIKGSAALAAMAALPMDAKAFLAGGIPAAASTNPAQPSPAATWGYNTLTFFDDFLSINTIDVNNTLQPGYNWYMQSPVYNSSTLLTFNAASCSVANSILTYNPNTPTGDAPNSGGNIYTAGFTAGGNYVGNTIQPTGWYAEAKIAYNPALASTQGSTWFPSFWMWDKSILYNGFHGLTFGGNRYSEFDIFQALPKTGPTASYIQTVYDRTSLSTVVQNTNITTGSYPPIDANYHKYGQLWVPPSKNNGTGLIKTYIDGVYLPDLTITYSSTTISPQAGTGATTGWMSGTEASTMGFTAQLQAATGWPMMVDYVMIWQP